MPDKNIAFVTFVQAASANEFFERVQHEGLVFKGKKVKIGWGKPTPLPTSVQTAVQQYSASRNVYIGSTDDQICEERLYNDFGEFGEIELVNLIPDKNIAFVNFTDILSAIRAVEAMKVNPDYHRYKINYGKDRCGNAPRACKAALAVAPESPEQTAAETPSEDSGEEARMSASFSGFGWGVSADGSPVNNKPTSISQPSTPNHLTGRVSSSSTPGIGSSYSSVFNPQYAKPAFPAPGTPPLHSSGSFGDKRRSNSSSPGSLSRQLTYLNLGTASPPANYKAADDALNTTPSW
jgi:RNA recognition motif-containing protein